MLKFEFFLGFPTDLYVLSIGKIPAAACEINSLVTNKNRLSSSLKYKYEVWLKRNETESQIEQHD